MEKAKLIQFPQSRKKRDKARARSSLNTDKKGSVYSRNGKLWVYFRYVGERVREPSGLEDTPANRKELRRQLDLVVAEIENGVFEFAKRFPHSSRKDHFTLLEGKTVTKGPEEVLFGEYVKRWWEEMRPGLSLNQAKDYNCALKNHLLPYFGDIPFSEFKPVLMKKFLAHMKGKKNRYGMPLSARSIRNYLVPLRVITMDAMDEFGWGGLGNPFSRLRLPKPTRMRVRPLNFEEWMRIREHMLPWYRPYFEFAVKTGLRPSEQVALKWSAIDEKFIYIELSRVRNREKSDLKTDESVRGIELRPNMRETLERQWELSSKFEQPYVFVNVEGRPIQQENLGRIWRRALEKGGVTYRRMYETRHTFASWALAAGESAEWVARTLGHVDTTMVYRTYSRFIPNLTRRDGSAFDRQFEEATSSKNDQNSHNFVHNEDFWDSRAT